MKTILTYLIGGTLMLGTFACSMPSRTTADAPSSAQKAGEAPTQKSAESTKEDATAKVRRDQLNSDIRAREQRNNVTGGDGDRANGDLSSEVRSKLEANIPMGKLTVEAKDGNIVISGTVPTQEQLSKIDSLAKQIKGVKTVNVAAQVAPAAPNKQ
jgi:hyperosmotically inducible periplasmic protein